VVPRPLKTEHTIHSDHSVALLDSFSGAFAKGDSLASLTGLTNPI
jgi:hypothetical protein